MSAEQWDDMMHGVSREDLEEACMEYVEVISYVACLLRAWREMGDDTLLDIMGFVLEDYDMQNYEFSEVEPDPEPEDDEEDNGTRH